MASHHGQPQSPWPLRIAWIAFWVLLFALMGLVLLICLPGRPAATPPAALDTLSQLLESPTPSPLPATPSPAPPTAEATPSPTPTPPPELIISAVGDCTLGGDPRNGQYDAFRHTLEANGGDWAYFFSGAAEYTAVDHLTIANLEGPLTDSDSSQDKLFAFRGDPSYAKILSQGGIEVVSLANNHAMDFGNQGYADTLEALEAEGVAASDVGKPVIHRSGEWVIGIATAKFPTKSRIEKLQADIAQLRDAGCHIIIAVMHWNEEGAEAPLPSGIDAGHAAIDAGADVVVGHHPHILQGIEVYNGRLIVHSLGNFVFGGNRKPDERETAIFQMRWLEVDGSLRPDAFRIIPYTVSAAEGNDYRPVELTGDAAQRAYDLINQRGTLLPEWAVVSEGWLAVP